MKTVHWVALGGACLVVGAIVVAVAFLAGGLFYGGSTPQLNQIEPTGLPPMIYQGEATQSDSSDKEPVDIGLEIETLESVNELMYHKYRAGEFTREQYERMKSMNDSELHKLKAEQILGGH